MTAMAAETYDLRTLLDAWEQTLRGVSMLGRVITSEQWLSLIHICRCRRRG